MKLALILAGGSGRRMENVDTPKQFLLLNNKAILLHTLEKFFLFKNEIDKMIIATHPVWQAYTRDLISKNFGEDASVFEVISGGETRHQTIKKGLCYIQDNYEIDSTDIILTHDAVRPFVSFRIIQDNLEYTARYGAVDTVIPAVDTIVCSEDGITIKNIPDRNNFYQGQTPQSFFIKELIDAYNQLSDIQLENTTDIAKVYRLLKKPVYLVMGEQVNYKITTPFDLSIARTMLEGTDVND
jgi:D-ribitol-5-phosphate cytidylyltransferase